MSSAVALLPEEPAGRVSTVSAGAALFEAVLSPDPDIGLDGDGLLLTIPDEPPPGVRVLSTCRTADPASLTQRLSCEVRSPSPSALAFALERLLRSVTARAALANAVLETQAFRLAVPAVYPAQLVESLARDLWDAGFPVSFGPSWTPAPGASVAVGAAGLEGEMEAFLRDHPAWQGASRVPSRS